MHFACTRRWYSLGLVAVAFALRPHLGFVSSTKAMACSAQEPLLCLQEALRCSLPLALSLVWQFVAATTALRLLRVRPFPGFELCTTQSYPSACREL